MNAVEEPMNSTFFFFFFLCYNYIIGPMKGRNNTEPESWKFTHIAWPKVARICVFIWGHLCNCIRVCKFFGDHSHLQCTIQLPEIYVLLEFLILYVPYGP